MSGHTKDVATRFVDLVLKHGRWAGIPALSEDEVRVLFDTVAAAGFSPKAVVPGMLEGKYHDQDGPTGQTYPINGLCQFKVVGEGGDDYSATGWLDCALRRVVHGTTRQDEGREDVIEAMVEEIEQSVPLEPIRLTPDGDLLREYPPSPLAFGLEYFVEHTRDEHDLDSCVGVHEHCNGWMDRHRATDVRDAIICRSCHLRVTFPRKVKTYGDLRRALAPLSVQVPT